MRSTLGAFLFSSTVVADEAPHQPELPDPLTLEYALSLAEELHPDLQQADAELRLAQAQRAQAEAISGLNATFEARLRAIEPAPRALSDSHDDHRVALLFSKRLYDFGRSEAAIGAAAAGIKGSKWSYLAATQRRRVEIQARFFDVILADLTYARDNEAMATAFVELDRARDRHELGQVSDVDLLELESIYQEARRRRHASGLRQRGTRSQLANALNRPGSLPSTVEMPQLPAADRELPEVETLSAAVVQDNPVMKALRERLLAARRSVDAARAERHPLLLGEVELAEYSLEYGSRDRARAGIILEVPLSTGGRVAAELAHARAELYRLEAIVAAKEIELRQAVLDLWLELNELVVRGEELEALRDFRELNLDRSRALYELEVNADLGDGMVQISDLKLQQVEHAFNTSLAWARLDTLLGKPAMARLREAP